jgi:hypothetical protein
MQFLPQWVLLVVRLGFKKYLQGLKMVLNNRVMFHLLCYVEKTQFCHKSTVIFVAFLYNSMLLTY